MANVNKMDWTHMILPVRIASLAATIEVMSFSYICWGCTWCTVCNDINWCCGGRGTCHTASGGPNAKEESHKRTNKPKQVCKQESYLTLSMNF